MPRNRAFSSVQFSLFYFSWWTVVRKILLLIRKRTRRVYTQALNYAPDAMLYFRQLCLWHRIPQIRLPRHCSFLRSERRLSLSQSCSLMSRSPVRPSRPFIHPSFPCWIYSRYGSYFTKKKETKNGVKSWGCIKCITLLHETAILTIVRGQWHAPTNPKTSPCVGSCVMIS